MRRRPWHPLRLPAQWPDRQRMLQRRAQDAWSRLAARERRLLVAGAGVALAAICWLAGVEPALAAIQHWQSELPRLRSQAIDVEQVLREVPTSQPSISPLPMATLVSQLDDAKLGGRYQVIPAGVPADERAGWLITLTGVSAAALIPWLMNQPQRLHLTLTDVSLVRASAAGQASADAAISGTVHLIPDKDIP